MSALPDIDPRIHCVGLSHLRKFNKFALENIGDHVYVIQESARPIAVMVSYEAFIEFQSILKEALNQKDRP